MPAPWHAATAATAPNAPVRLESSRDRPAQAGGHPDAAALLRAAPKNGKPQDTSASAECKAAVRDYEADALASPRDLQRMEAKRLAVNIACGTTGGGDVAFVRAGGRDKLSVCGSAFEQGCKRPATPAR